MADSRCSVHHIPQDASTRVNWTEFNEQGFKDGVVHPFIKYIHWMGVLSCSTFYPHTYRVFTEDTKGTQDGIIKPTTSATTVPTPSLPPPPAVLPSAIPTSQQLGECKKRGFVYTEGSSDDEEDVDMDIDSNNSSGSSVDSDHVPTKRLQTSTIITRGSRVTPAPKKAIAGHNHRHGSPSASTGDHFSGLDEPNAEAETELETEPETGTEPETEPETGTEPDTGTELETNPEAGRAELETEIPGVTSARFPSTHTNNLTRRTTTTAMPTRCVSPDMDVDVVVNGSGTSSGTGDTARVSARRSRKPVNTPAAPSQPPSPAIPDLGSRSMVPDFLLGKNDIYGYLSCVEETRFCNLLTAYITFESANHSCIRSGHSTANRPNAIRWWTGRARPNRLPPFDSLKSFTKSILLWWTTIQPHWREIQPGTISRVEGDWEYLYKPGVNGFLNVVILAYWWVKISEERGCDIDEMYSWFVADVTWVLSQLTIAAHKGIF